MNDFKKLDETKHMLEWLYGDAPYIEIFNSVQDILKEQKANSILQEFCVTSNPDWLTRAIKQDDDSNFVILKGAGIAFEFLLTVELDNEPYQLSGVWTSVGYNLNDNPTQKVWLDIDGTLAEFGKDGALYERVYLK
ncbi:hypothetical protein [Moraxella oblonga]|uniref:hypothetical protein n=1 Tax=Moraxella oblonga TaxID=200413 RepID=UPI000829A1A2|nr:hypothetical protein [Moraxella oblonga]